MTGLLASADLDPTIQRGEALAQECEVAARLFSQMMRVFKTLYLCCFVFAGLQVQELRKRSDALPDDYLVVFVGDMITEEALPTYMTMLNTLDGVRDETGASKTPWATWTRAWTAEENRHGDLMNKYMYLTGRVNMKSIEVTIQNLIGSGMDPKTENNPYLGFVYTSFQERATKVRTRGRP